MKITNKQLKQIIKEELEKVLNESVGEMPYRAKVVLGLVPGQDSAIIDTVYDPFGERWAAQFMDDDPDHKTLWYALQDLSDVIARGYENDTGQIKIKPGPLQGGDRLPYILRKLEEAKAIVMSGPKPFIIEQDVLEYALNAIEPLLKGM